VWAISCFITPYVLVRLHKDTIQQGITSGVVGRNAPYIAPVKTNFYTRHINKPNYKSV